MNFNIIVLAKQVPDTRHVGREAINADGTINRAALPVIFNPDDMRALEQALRLKDQYPGSTVKVLTMGPSRAAEIVREGLFRGSDGGVLLSDCDFAGADTLATSYVLSTAIRTMGTYDIIFCGRHTLDGETSQVGPQVAAQLGIPQVTYAHDILGITENDIRVRRCIDGGLEIVDAPLPVLITVDGTAEPCRPRHAKLLMTYKHADVTEWSLTDIDADRKRCGLMGSATKVKSIDPVVLKAKDNRVLPSTNEAIDSLIVELVRNHIIG